MGQAGFNPIVLITFLLRAKQQQICEENPCVSKELSVTRSSSDAGDESGPSECCEARAASDGNRGRLYRHGQGAAAAATQGHTCCIKTSTRRVFVSFAYWATSVDGTVSTRAMSSGVSSGTEQRARLVECVRLICVDGRGAGRARRAGRSPDERRISHDRSHTGRDRQKHVVAACL